MASLPVFTILCCAQLGIGLLLFIFGIVDRTVVQVGASFLMLPIWTGLLVGIAGFCGLMVGRYNKRQGFPSVNGVSGVKAIHATCVGLSLLGILLYGNVLATIGVVFANPDTEYPVTVGKTDIDTAQGILAMIFIFCLAEMLTGFFVAMLDKDQMVFGSPGPQNRGPLISNEASPSYYQQHAQQTFQAAPQQQQQQQQP